MTAYVYLFCHECTYTKVRLLVIACTLSLLVCVPTGCCSKKNASKWIVLACCSWSSKRVESFTIAYSQATIFWPVSYVYENRSFSSH